MAVEPAPVGEAPPYRYRVRLRAQNPLLDLRPGMSATVTLDLASPPEALRVPAQALRFSPEGAAAATAAPARSGGGHAGALHVLDSRGRLRREPVEVGVSDGISWRCAGPRSRRGTRWWSPAAEAQPARLARRGRCCRATTRLRPRRLAS